MTSILRLLIPLTLILAFQVTGHGQTTAPAGLRDRVAMRFDIVALQQGVALVPREAASTVRMVQVIDGVVTVDGVSLTGGQLRDRLGADADLVLQVSYLDREQQRALVTGGVPGGAGATFDPPPAAPAPDTVERSEVRRGDIIRFGDEVTVGRNERVEGDVVVFGDSADIDGEVTGDVTVFGDELRLGPDAIVRGDVNAIGGNLDREDGAQVMGDVNEVGRGRGQVNGDWFGNRAFGGAWSRVWGLGATIFRFTVLILVALIIAAFGRNAVERIAARTAATPVRSGLIGLAGQILFLPVLVLTVIVLAVSIVGIPLLILVPFAILLLMLVALIGFVAVAYQVGGRLIGKFGWSKTSVYSAVAIGVVAIGLMTLLGKLAGLAIGFFVALPLTGIGYLLEYVAWTMGFGAALLHWYEMQPGWVGRRRTRSGDPDPGSPLPDPGV